MKQILILKLFLCIFYIVSAQDRVYYGLPNDNHIEIGDLIILNIPKHDLNTGRITDSDELDKLGYFLTQNKDLNFNVSFHYFQGSVEFLMDYTKRLGQDLKKILNEKGIINFDTLSFGNTSPIYCDKSDIVKYFRINTRLEISISNKNSQ